MRAALIAATLAAAVVLAACGGDDDDGAEPTRADGHSTPIATSAAPTTAPSSSTAEVEVVGIVGVVDAGGNTIEIRATGNSPITEIAVGPVTRILTARGNTIRLSDIRPSDRISARGRVSNDPAVLAATEIRVQEVVQGGPGSGG